MSTEIHPTAIVEKGAELDEGVFVGPYAFIGATAKIGAGTKVHNHATVEGPSTIGKNNQIFPYAAVGTAPQDLSFEGEETFLEMGDGNVVREYVTINRGTAKDQRITKVGDNNLFMACSHVAHDCVLENNIVMANGVLIGGHVHIEDNVVISGLCGVHHYVRMGRASFVSGHASVRTDVPPFMLMAGEPLRPVKINTIGLQRSGLSKVKHWTSTLSPVAASCIYQC